MLNTTQMFDLQKNQKNKSAEKRSENKERLITSTNAPCPGSNDNILTATMLLRQFAL